MVTSNTIIGATICFISFTAMMLLQCIEEERNFAHYLTFMIDILLSMALIMIELPVIIEIGILAVIVLLKILLPTGRLYTLIGVIASVMYALSSMFLICEKTLPIEVPALHSLKLFEFEKTKEIASDNHPIV